MALDMGQDQGVSGISIMMMMIIILMMMMMMMVMMMLRDRYKHWFLRASKSQINAKERSRLKWENNKK
jgi:hypothetical protein